MKNANAMDLIFGTDTLEPVAIKDGHDDYHAGYASPARRDLAPSGGVATPNGEPAAESFFDHRSQCSSCSSGRVNECSTGYAILCRDILRQEAA